MRSRAPKRLDPKGIVDVLAMLRAPLTDGSPDTFGLTLARAISDLEREIFVASTPGAYIAESTHKGGRYGEKSTLVMAYGDDGNPLLTPLPYMSDLRVTWALIRRAAPGIGITCEFLPDGNMQILAVHGPNGKDIQADWPLFRPERALLIALFEYLVVLTALPAVRVRAAPQRRAGGVGVVF